MKTPFESQRDHFAYCRYRDAGRIRRMHTYPKPHDPYTVSQHCYNAVTLLFLLHPSPSSDLIKTVLWHDSAELMLGDVPAPAKATNPALAEAYEAAEQDVERRSFPHLTKAKQRLTVEELVWLELVDRLEFLLWVYEQDDRELRSSTWSGFEKLLEKTYFASAIPRSHLEEIREFAANIRPS